MAWKHTPVMAFALWFAPLFVRYETKTLVPQPTTNFDRSRSPSRTEVRVESRKLSIISWPGSSSAKRFSGNGLTWDSLINGFEDDAMIRQSATMRRIASCLGYRALRSISGNGLEEVALPLRVGRTFQPFNAPS